MRPIRRSIAALAAAAILLPASAASVAAPARAPSSSPGPGPGSIAPYHASDDGHLPPSQRNVDLVGRVQLTNVSWGIGDVTALGDWAYLAAYAPECFNETGSGGGVHVVNISVPQLPVETGFISAGDNTYVGEGVHAISLNTKRFTGDVLVMSNEPCDYRAGANGGVSLWDISDPLEPQPLAIGVGDKKPRTHLSAHSSHSAMAWTTGKRAYVALVDNHESGYGDIDILNITNPRKPKLIAETGLARWRRANRGRSVNAGAFPSSFHHDMWVQKIKGHWYLLASYWDTGWVVLNVDKPRKPRFVRDSNFPRRDPFTGERPEGNAHQAVWTNNGKYIIGATEDFRAKLTYVTAGGGGFRRGLNAVEVPGARSLSGKFGYLTGPTVYGGTGCAPFAVPAASSEFGNLRNGKPIVILSEDGGCSTRDKLVAADVAGYAAAIIATSHASTTFGLDPDRLRCDSLVGARPSIHGFCITHEDFHQLLRSEPEFLDPVLSEPKVGDRGEPIQVTSQFDGSWGHLRVLRAKNLKEVSVFAIPEAVSASYGAGFGPLTVHEVKMDPRRKKQLAYASWYSGGLRVLKVKRNGRLKEVGHYIGPDGNNFWGTFPHKRELDAEPLLLMSDVNYGLYVLRYTS